MPWLTRKAEKDLAALSSALRERAMAVLAALDLDPALGKKLQGRLAGRRSARLGATHRIIHVVEERGVVVIAIQPRRDAYR